jgi:heat shock protein HslJ
MCSRQLKCSRGGSSWKQGDAIPQGAAASLMSMIMPVVVGLLGREVRERGLNATGLVNLLRSERETLEGARPADLDESQSHGVVREPVRVVETPRPARASAGFSPWLWLLLPLLGLIGLGLWYASRPTQTVVPAGTTTSLVGTRWHWEHTRLNDGREQRPADAASYALDFQHDGSASVQADCNTANGSYRIDGANLAIAGLAGTKAACSGASLSEVFVQQLQNSEMYLLRDGKLLVNLKTNAGTMEFVPAR